eukprot:scaffold162027_cov29-Tisochrysis_lutea.AAC.3
MQWTRARRVDEPTPHAEEADGFGRKLKLQSVQGIAIGGYPPRPKVGCFSDCAIPRAWHITKNAVKLEKIFLAALKANMPNRRRDRCMRGGKSLRQVPSIVTAHQQFS